MARKLTVGAVLWVLLKVTVRGATGQHLNGRRRSDATFWRDGTEAEAHHWSRNPWWPRLAGWKRAAVTFWVPLAVGWCVLFRRAATEWASAVIAGVAFGCGLILAYLWWDEREHRRKVTQFAKAIAAPAGYAAIEAPKAVHVPTDYLDREDAEIVVDVPPDFIARDRDMDDITQAVTVKLGLPNPKVTKALDSRTPRLIYTRSVPPPLGVSLKDIRPYIEAAKPSQVILGLAAHRKPIDLDLDSEVPMVGVSMTTGDGKSEFAKNMGAQLLYHGAILMVLDYKLVSHMWADGLPNVCYARTPPEIQEALMWLAWDEYDADGNVIRPSELTRRKQVMLAARRNGEQVHETRLVILSEERNATGRALRRFHRRMGGKGASPALESMDETGETGRQVGVNALYIAQRLSAKASGSDGSRDAMENIGAIITKDPPEQTWKLLAGGHAQPPRSGHKGRYQLITKAGVTEFQGVLYDKDPDESDRIARELATAGVIGEVRSDMPFVNRGGLLVPAGIGHGAFARQEGSEQAFVVGQDAPVIGAGTGPLAAVTLAEAVAAGLFVSKAAARQARQRRKWEPVVEDPVNGNRYALKDLAAYKREKVSR